MNNRPGENYSTKDAVYFYTPRYYPFDNFSAFSIDIWEKSFPTVEHAYQWKKYAESAPELAAQIFVATNPHQVKKISDAHKVEIPPSWHEEKIGIMEELLRAKVDQHEKMHDLLLETADKEIIENSPTDSYWGIGEEGTGENVLGKLWMRLRRELL